MESPAVWKAGSCGGGVLLPPGCSTPEISTRQFTTNIWWQQNAQDHESADGERITVIQAVCPEQTGGG